MRGRERQRWMAWKHLEGQLQINTTAPWGHTRKVPEDMALARGQRDRQIGRPPAPSERK